MFWRSIQSFTINYDVSCTVSIDALSQIKIPFIPNLLLLTGCSILYNAFFMCLLRDLILGTAYWNILWWNVMMKIAYSSVIWKRELWVGFVMRWTGCSKVVRAGKCRWGVYGFWKLEEKTLGILLLVFHQKLHKMAVEEHS